jgi:hypothetical protein
MKEQQSMTQNNNHPSQNGWQNTNNTPSILLVHTLIMVIHMETYESLFIGKIAIVKRHGFMTCVNKPNSLLITY